MFIGKYNKSVILTYIGVISGIIGMNFAINKNINYAMVCLVISGICDLFDGKIARSCKRDKDEINFGVQIDSLSDMVSFVILPVIIGYGLGLNSFYHIIGYCLLTVAGVVRLGYFNIIVNGDTPVKYYSGLPVTSTSIIVPLLYLTNLFTSSYNLIYIVSIYLIGLLYILNIKVPKFKGKAYYILAVLGIIGIFVILKWCI